MGVDGGVQRRSDARLGREDAALVADARVALAEAWTQPDYWDAAVAALRPLIPSSTPAVFTWRGPDLARPEVLAPALHRAVDTSWFRGGLMRKHIPYDPRRRDPRANRVVSTADLRRANPRAFAVYRETALEPLGLADHVRATIYQGPRFLVMAGFWRAAGLPAHSPRERRVLQALVPDLVEVFGARCAAERAHLQPGAILQLAEALAEPAFIATPGGALVHANAAARAAYPRRPAWLRPCSCSPRRRGPPPWVRCTSLALEGRRLCLLLPETIDLDVDHAPQSPWALHWQLPPRLARVAVLLMRGLPDKAIADELGLAHNSVRTYVRGVLGRAGVSSRAELLRAALALVRPPR